MKSLYRKRTHWLIFIPFLLAACQVPPAALPPSALQTLTAAPVIASATPSETPFRLPTLLPSATVEISATVPRLPTFTPAVTATATEFVEMMATIEGTQVALMGIVNDQSNCRLGPGVAYLFTHALFPGDEVVVRGRNWNGSWLWVKPENLDRHCWAAASVMDVEGDKNTAPRVSTHLQQSRRAIPPASVSASREGNQVVVSWSEVKLASGTHMGYLVEVSVCQNNVLNRIAVGTQETEVRFNESGTCELPSGGNVYTAEELGYSDPVRIPWP